MHQTLINLLAELGIIASNDALLVIVIIIALAIGIVCGRHLLARKYKKAEQKLRDQYQQERDFLDQQLDQMTHTFNSISQQALKSNNESFLTLAQQSFAQLQSNAANELKAREASFANLLQPIQQSMHQTDQQLKKLDQDRIVTETRLSEQIGNLLSTQHSLQAETRNLVTALRRPEVRGQWGELTLKRLVELAGMSEYCDYQQQATVKGEQGTLRPDMLIHLPSDRTLVVDVKTPLDAYLKATETSDDKLKQEHLAHHARIVKQRVKELSQKQYWQQFQNSPDFVILFIPGDQFLSAALDQDSSLLEYALQNRILLTTPSSLVGLLRAVAYGWSQDKLSKNSEEVRKLGESLHSRLQTLTLHLNKLGKHLDQSVDQFNKVVGSYQANALPAIRKLSELGISNEETHQTESLQTGPSRRLTENDNNN